MEEEPEEVEDSEQIVSDWSSDEGGVSIPSCPADMSIKRKQRGVRVNKFRRESSNLHCKFVKISYQDRTGQESNCSLSIKYPGTVLGTLIDSYIYICTCWGTGTRVIHVVHTRTSTTSIVLLYMQWNKCSGTSRGRAVDVLVPLN